MRLKLLIFYLFLTFECFLVNCYRFGAIFREREDAHLVSSFIYAIEWINTHRPFGRFEYVIEFVNDGDHFGAIGKACKLIEEEKVIALFGSSDVYVNMQLKKITDQLDIPFFTVIDDFLINRSPNLFTRTKKDSEIRLFPQAQLLESLSDLIRHWRWSRIIVVFVESSRIARLVPFLEKEIYSGIRFHFVQIKNQNFHSKINEMKNKGFRFGTKDFENLDFHAEEKESEDDNFHSGTKDFENEDFRLGIKEIENHNFLTGTKEIKELEDCTKSHQKECSDFSRILVDMNPEDSYKFFLAGLQMGFIELKHWFLLTSMDLKTMDMELFKHNHARFISTSPISPDFLRLEKNNFNLEKFERLIRKDWEKKNGKNRNFRLSEAAFMFDAVFLASHSVFNMSQLYAIKNDVHFARCRSTMSAHVPFHYGNRLIDHIKNTTIYGLTGDLSRVNPKSIHGNFSLRIQLLGYAGNIDDIGFWESKTDVNVNMSRDSYAQLQHNVQVSDELKPHFRVTTIMERPYIMLKKNHFELNENNQFEGFCIDLLEELSKDLGFTYAIHVVRDNKYGNDVYGNGTWDGMIGEILGGQADMAVAPFTVNFRRAEVVDFTKPFLSLGISILFKIPADHQPDLFSFLNPLSLEIWFWILVSIVGVTVGMYIAARITPYEWNLNFSCCTAHQPHPAAEYSDTDEVPIQLSNNYSFYNTVWYVLSTMLKGGCDFGPRAVSTRLLGGTWWFFTLVLVSAYTANLAAVLTVSKPHIPIRNLDDLANQSKISYGTIKGGSTMQFFQESKIPGHVKMWNYMKNKDVFVESNREGVQRVMSEDYAYLMESTSLEYEVQQNCNLTQIGGVLGSKGYGIALRKHSEWTDRISRQLLLYQKRGIIEIKKQKWWRSTGTPCSGVGSTLKQDHISLNFYNISGLFLTLFMGIFGAILIVVGEFCVRARELSKTKNSPFFHELIQELRFALQLNDIQNHPTRMERKKSLMLPEVK